ncbi:MAG TPA: hypothetical protein VFD33_02085 [Bacillota bacterium]|nr:hypothetical protein [Bacillota bacterium]
MLFIFMGSSCTGKSTAANKIKERLDVEVFTGKDYLRMAKNKYEAWKLFYDKLLKASLKQDPVKGTIIYLITEKEELIKVKDIKNSYKIKFTAPLDIIKERFSQRMNGILPKPVEDMLERKNKEWEAIDGDMTVDSSQEEEIEKLMQLFTG